MLMNLTAIFRLLCASYILNLNHSVGLFSRRRTDDIFFFFPKSKKEMTFQAIFPLETICMKCQNPFSGEEKNISICRLLEHLPRLLSVDSAIQFLPYSVTIEIYNLMKLAGKFTVIKGQI